MAFGYGMNRMGVGVGVGTMQPMGGFGGSQMGAMGLGLGLGIGLGMGMAESSQLSPEASEMGQMGQMGMGNQQQEMMMLMRMLMEMLMEMTGQGGSGSPFGGSPCGGSPVGGFPGAFPGFPSGGSPMGGAPYSGSTGSYSPSSGPSSSGSPSASPMVGDPGQISNKTQWANALLKSLGDPTTPQNVQSLVNWAGREGGNWNNSAHFNPLNTTQNAPGATSMNSEGVKRYTSWQQGIQATVDTLHNGRYNDILSALQSGQGLQNGTAAHGLSTWSGGAYSSI